MGVTSKLIQETLLLQLYTKLLTLLTFSY